MIGDKSAITILVTNNVGNIWDSSHSQDVGGLLLLCYVTMHSSAKPQSPPLSVLSLCSCDKVYHKKEVHLVFTRVLPENHNPNPLD